MAEKTKAQEDQGPTNGMREGERGSDNNAQTDTAESMNEGGILDVGFEKGERGFSRLGVIGEHKLTMRAS